MKLMNIIESRGYEDEDDHNQGNKQSTWTWRICKKVAGVFDTETLAYGDYTGKRKEAVRIAKAQAKELGGSICDFGNW